MTGMLRVTVKGLLAHKLRLTLTALSVVLGVAFVSGTLVLTDTMRHTFDELFDDVLANVDVTVRAKSGFGEAETGADSARNTLPESLVETVKAVPGVKAAKGTVGGYAQIVAPDGKAVTTSGAPTLGLNWSTNTDLSSLKLRTGRAPEGDGEVVIDVATAEKHGLAVGQQVSILFRTGTGRFRIVGLTGFGRADNLAGATIAAFELRTAQRVLGKVGLVDSIDAAAGGVSALVLRDRIVEAMPPTAEAVTSDQVAQEGSEAVKDGLSFFGNFLLTFAGISLFVGSFIIFNTFSILVAQRTRELALLRALGASQAQVLRSVLTEAFIVGIVSSAVGLGLGVVFAVGLKSLLSAFGIDLPSTSMQFLPRTVIASFVVGVGVTLVAAVAPARRASKVAPIAALRDPSDGGAGSLRTQAILGAATAALGLLSLAGGLFGNDDNPLPKVGLGASLTFLGIAILSPFVARPLASAIGAPLTRRGHTAPKLGRENAMRNPRRTASASAALMIGLGVVAAATVLAASVKESSGKVFDRSVTADYALSADQSMAAISPRLAGEMADLPEVAAVTELAGGEWRLNGNRKGLYATTAATVDDTLNVAMTSGELAGLERGELLIEDSVAKENGLAVGAVLPMTFARTGTQDVRIGGTYERNELLGNYLISLQLFDANYTDRLNFAVLVKTAPGVSADAARSSISEAAADFPNVKVQDRARVREESRRGVDQLLNLISALLLLAIIIALFGIVNTLVLSVLERTRELGLLRAVGMTRRQVRTMVRTESIITSVMGAVLGLAIGVLFGVVIQKALESEGVDSLVVPIGSLLAYVLAAALAGVLAAVGPARKAAKLDVLQAISHE